MAKLYLISPPQIELNKFVEQYKSAILTGGVAAFQLRLKDVDDDYIIRAAEKLMPIALENEVPFIINDSVNIAKKINASGVHLGGDDLAIKQAREVLGGDYIIGASCYNSIDLAIDAAQSGADYVSFGAFHPTKTKIAKAKAELKILETWSTATQIPACAIGGITPENCQPLIEAGADFICVISYIWNHPQSAAKAVAEFQSVILSEAGDSGFIN